MSWKRPPSWGTTSVLSHGKKSNSGGGGIRSVIDAASNAVSGALRETSHPLLSNPGSGDPILRKGHVPHLHRPFRRGVIYTAPGSPGPRRNFNFLFNPASLQMAYDMDDSILNQQDAPPEAQAALALVQGGSLSFALEFDRYWEVGVDPRHPGVMIDVDTFEGLVAMEGAGITAPSASRVVVNFGGSPERPLEFEGHISSASWTFTHFSHSMTPVRGRLELTVRRVDSSGGGGGSGGGGSSSAASAEDYVQRNAGRDTAQANRPPSPGPGPVTHWGRSALPSWGTPNPGNTGSRMLYDPPARVL